MSPHRITMTCVTLCLVFPLSTVAADPATWNLLPNSPLAGTAIRHDDLTFIDALKGWLVNGNGDIYSTSDGGNSWTHLADTGKYNRCVAFTDSQHGFVGHLNSGNALAKTTNAGVNWTSVSLPAPAPAGLCGLWAASSQVVYGVGAYYGFPTLIKTTDNGANWTSQSLSAWCGALVDCYFWHPDSGIAVGSTNPGPTRQSRILRTTDGGNTWTVTWTGSRLREICWKISFVSRNVGFVSLENLSGAGSAYYLKTKDAGLNWREEVFSTEFSDCQGIGFVDENTGWMGGWNFETQATTDGGLSWTPAFGMHVNRIRFLSPELGFACGDRVYKFSVPVSGAGDASPPRHRLLEQNNPNPFERQTRIRYRVEEAGPVTLRLFDLSGREVRTVFQGTRSAGNYEAIVDADNLPAGVYVFRLSTVAGTETRKITIN